VPRLRVGRLADEEDGVYVPLPRFILRRPVVVLARRQVAGGFIGHENETGIRHRPSDWSNPPLAALQQFA